MILGLLAAAALAGPLNLELSCQVQYEDEEISRSVGGAMVNGVYVPRTAITRTPVTRNGTLRLSLHGEAGHAVLPDGRTRELEIRQADSARILAEYSVTLDGLLSRKKTIVWSVQLDRMTGDLHWTSGQLVAYTGACAPVSDQPKF